MTGIEVVFVFYMFANLMNLDNMMNERDEQIHELQIETFEQAGSIDALEQDAYINDKRITKLQNNVNALEQQLEQDQKE
jgi:hypothetical protein